MAPARTAGPRPPFLSEAQARLWSLRAERVPLPLQAAALLIRWAEEVGLPEEPGEFLHLLHLSGTSESLTLSLLRTPTLLKAMSREAREPGPQGRDRLEEALGRHLLRGGGEAVESRLTSFRMLETARILVQETLGTLSFEEVAGELSDLSDVLIARAFAITHQPLRERLGLPMQVLPGGRARPCTLAVLALGKLGGRELNYASDVDLVCFFEEDGRTDMGEENARFFNAWVREASSLLTRLTADGPCFKIDPNLRPRGRDGELTVSFSAALAYYRDWADLWERQAWIKGRPCAGDLAAGARFLRLLEGEIYREYAFSGIAYQNRSVREKTLSRLRGRDPEGPERDIKEGRGGLRDVEFAVQALQMAYGQSDRWVREPNTLIALARLRQKACLAESEMASLARAYVILRKAEHWAQVRGMRQTHDLPDSEASWIGFARYAGLGGPKEGREDLERARETASALFALILARLARASSAQDAVGVLLEPEELAKALAAASLPESDRVAPLLAEFYGALEPFLTTRRRRNSFLRIHFSLMREVSVAPEPVRELQALHRLLPTLCGEAGLLAFILDHPRVPRLLCRISARSELLGAALQQWPSLLRHLSYRDLRRTPEKVSSLRGAAGLDPLRRGLREVLFLTGARWTLMGERAPWVSARLTEAAEATLERVLISVAADLEARHGLPPGSLLRDLAILGLGRLGSGEMLPRSDLDLLFVKRGRWLLPDSPDRSAFLEGLLVREIAGALTGVTRFGTLYPVDLRLRPDGASGPPITASEALEDYLACRAELWERLALLKARPVAGNLSLGRGVAQGIRKAVLWKGLGPREVERLGALRERLERAHPTLEGALKFGAGGLMEMDLFLGCALVRARAEPPPGGKPAAIAVLAELGVLSAEESEGLWAALAFQEDLLLRFRLTFLRPPGRARLADILGNLARQGGRPEASPGELLEASKLHSSRVRRAWEGLLKTVGGAG